MDGFFIEVADEVLEHVEFVARKIAEAHKKRTDSGAALNAGRFGVEEDDAIACGNSARLVHQIHEGSRSAGREATQANLSVEVVVRMDDPDDVVRAERCGFDFARREDVGGVE